MKGKHTIREISQQPDVWLKEFESIKQEKERIVSFLSKNKITKDTDIILTGAGTSAFIGGSLAVTLPLKGYVNSRAVATTDLLTHPGSYFSADRETVLVSFARSGNSPESLAAVELADKMAKKAIHILITCNKDGQLTARANSDDALLVLLPPETNDKSLAMTSSYSTMMLSFMLVMNAESIESEQEAIEQISKSAKQLIAEKSEDINTIAKLDFKRAVFLGSGELKSVAEECHLKLQELTDGQVVCKHDSFLGFRHGPKAVIDSTTLMVYLFSSDEHTRRYEIDLVKQINGNNKVVAQVGISAGSPVEIEGVTLDLNIDMEGLNQAANEYSMIPYAVAGQLLGYFKSLAMGLNPDSPSVSGNIARVVEGVTIYNKEK